jgi:hypothetical protein
MNAFVSIHINDTSTGFLFSFVPVSGVLVVFESLLKILKITRRSSAHHTIGTR